MRKRGGFTPLEIGIPNRERGRFLRKESLGLTVFTNSLFLDWSVRKIGLKAARLGEGQAVAREGFGDGECRRSHPQAALEAATLSNYQIKFDRAIGKSEESLMIDTGFSAFFL